MSDNKIFTTLFVMLLILCAVLTLCIGDVPLADAWSGAVARLQGKSTAWNPLLDERIPRLLVTLCTGASLAVSGAVMQSLFHNPLASPSVLGISCGGSLLVILVYVNEWHYTYPYAIPIAAITGCLLTLMLVFMLSQRNHDMQLHHLILTGIAISTLLIALQGVIMYTLRDRWQLLQTLTEWEAGTTMDRTWQHVNMQLPLTIVGLVGCWKYRYEMDLLTLGIEEAKNLGVDVMTVRWHLFLCVSLLTGGALAAVGIIAFFGLVLPHLLRSLFGPLNRRLIPLCIIAGGAVFSSMDISLRLFDIHTFTIGNMSAILGGLFFLILLLGSRNKNMLSTGTSSR